MYRAGCNSTCPADNQHRTAAAALPVLRTAEYTAAEVQQGLHTNSLKFAFESKSERGWANNASTKDAEPVKPVHVKAGTA
jgi:hypothetical protein